jgi:hypothetical protein
MSPRSPDSHSKHRTCRRDRRAWHGAAPPNGGPGRPKGSRNKLGEAFIADVYAKWLARGGETLERMIDTDPGGFVRVVAGVLPDKLEVDVKHQIARIERVIVSDKRELVVDHAPLEGACPALTRSHADERLSSDIKDLDPENT